MITFPNAKINIGLNITNRRSDGYHDLETVFYPVQIKDALEIVETEKLTFTSSGISIPGNPADNLCLKAFHLISKDYEIRPVHIHLHKNIPIGAGLGGGSADAAFFIQLLNDKFELGMDIFQMERYAKQLGADCAFFLRNKAVFAFGKGDEFEQVELDLSHYFIVVVKPRVHVSTQEAYQGVKPTFPEQSLRQLISLPVETWKDSIVNDFEFSIFTNHQELIEVKSALYSAGAVFAAMSGSGSSIYAIFSAPVKLIELELENQVFYGV